MSTLNALNTLIGIVNSRKNKLNPTGPMPSAAAGSDPNQTNPTLPVDPATSPTASSPANVNPPSNPSPSDPDGSDKSRGIAAHGRAFAVAHASCAE